MKATWLAVPVVAAVAVLCLVVALAGWASYRRRRANLDAAGVGS